jgi:hypothetical protein
VSTATPGGQHERWTRFSALAELHNELTSCFPLEAELAKIATTSVFNLNKEATATGANGLPPLPPKTWGSSSAAKGGQFAEQRRMKIETYLHACLRTPRGVRLPYLLDFLALGVTAAPPVSLRQTYGGMLAAHETNASHPPRATVAEASSLRSGPVPTNSSPDFAPPAPAVAPTLDLFGRASDDDGGNGDGNGGDSGGGDSGGGGGGGGGDACGLFGRPTEPESDRDGGLFGGDDSDDALFAGTGLAGPEKEHAVSPSPVDARPLLSHHAVAAPSRMRCRVAP